MPALAVTTKLLIKIALLSLMGQGEAGNPVYRLFQVISQPWVRAVRWVRPRVMFDRHMPLMAAFLMLMLWAVATVAKVNICMPIGVALCK